MAKGKLVAVVAAFMAVGALAHGQSQHVGNQIRSSALPLAGFNLTAPIIENRTNLPGDTPFGSIVYDVNSVGFFGLSSTGTWTQLGYPSGLPKAATRQVFTSGSSTYTTPTNPVPLYLRIRMVGGGGGGGGESTGNSSGGAGGATTFNSVSAGGGGGGGGGSSFTGGKFERTSKFC